MSRRTEILIGSIAVGGALLLSAIVFVWRVAYDDAPWSLPPLPRMERLGAFGIYSWLETISVVAFALMFIVAAIRRNGRWMTPGLAVVVSFTTAVLYLPLGFLPIDRVDRLQGPVEEPNPDLRALVVAVMLTLILSLSFLAVTRLRRTPDIARRTALVVLNTCLLHLFWVPMFLPFWWQPAERDRWELYVPVRPCRGATLWAYNRNRFQEIAVIDDIWLNFADPRNGKAPTFAVSVDGHWRRAYFWLNSSDLQPLRVHQHDPALVRCDAQPRPERVAPAVWHELGFEW